jgi:hypothetical protein
VEQHRAECFSVALEALQGKGEGDKQKPQYSLLPIQAIVQAWAPDHAAGGITGKLPIMQKGAALTNFSCCCNIRALRKSSLRPK